MPVSVADFIDQVRSEVDFLDEAYSHVGRGKEWSFAQLVLQMLFPVLDSDQAFNLLASPDTAAPVHAAYADEQSGTFYLLTVRYAENPNTARSGPGVVYSFLDYVNEVKREAGAPAQAEESKSTIDTQAADAVRDGYTLTAILVLWGELDPGVDVDDQRNRYALGEQEFVVYDLNSLRRLAAGMERDQDVTSTEISLLESALHSGPVEALLGSVSTSEWRRALEPLGDEIYDVNVRTPLGLRSKINKQMRLTIGSPQDRAFFWYYNNGITVLCRGFQPVAGIPHRYTIVSPRIVNGAQTTQAILEYAPNDGDDAAVPVRFIAALPGSEQVTPELAADPQLLQDLYLNIAKYTNSQNPIELPDFRSNEEVQRRLHQKFLVLNWFYEHRRGQWENAENKAEFRIAGGGYRRLTMVDLAQEWFAFAGHPSTAIRERLSLFEEQGHYSSIFMLMRSAEEYLVAHLLFQQLQIQIKDQIKQAKADAERVAETGGVVSLETRNYLAIGRATKLAVAHLTALLGRAFAEHYGQFNVHAARAVLPSLEDGTLIDGVYAELEDTLFRALGEIAGDKYRTFHQFLSEAAAAERLEETFKYVLVREQRKKRSPLHLPALAADGDG